MIGRRILSIVGIKGFCVMWLIAVNVSCGRSVADHVIFRGPVPKVVLGSSDELYRFLTYDEQRYPLVSAHRGGPMKGYPENALETFEFQSKRQPLIIECDIQMTRDSVLILMHDATLDRTSDGEGVIAHHTYEEIQSLRLKDPDGTLTTFGIPTLDEALQWGVGNVIFMLDVKRGVPYSRVVDVVQRNRAEAYAIIATSTADEALEVHRLDPSLMISVLIHSKMDFLRISDRNVPDNRLVAFVGTGEANEQVYELLHGHGIMCILRTTAHPDGAAEQMDAEYFERLVESGADIISTDQPIIAGKALEIYRKKNRLVSDFIK